MEIVIDVKSENAINKVLSLLNEIDGVEIKKWDYWKEEELKNFGKITYGLSSNDFGDENEDYSKW